MIHFNKNPEYVRNALFGVANLADGLVRTLSFGFLFTDWPLVVSRETARRRFAKFKREAQRRSA